jgi:hypothetical protein
VDSLKYDFLKNTMHLVFVSGGGGGSLDSD